MKNRVDYSPVFLNNNDFLIVFFIVEFEKKGLFFLNWAIFYLVNDYIFKLLNRWIWRTLYKIGLNLWNSCRHLNLLLIIYIK